MVAMEMRDHDVGNCGHAAGFAAATIRFASRESNPGQPVSTSIDCPVGQTMNVACPPSVSMEYI